MDDQEPVTISVRMPPQLAEWLKQQAAESLRSLSAEAVWQLQRRQLAVASAPATAGT